MTAHIQQVAVVGAGYMGGGIAQVFAMAGHGLDSLDYRLAGTRPGDELDPGDERGPDIGNFVRLHRPLEPVQDMLDKLLPYANYWHVKNYLRDEDPVTGHVMTFPVPMEWGLINYRSAISQALALGFRGAFLCEHYGSDAITVIGKNRAYVRDILATTIE
jgi:hypothetical protein